jgi:hypothetical protein
MSTVEGAHMWVFLDGDNSVILAEHATGDGHAAFTLHTTRDAATAREWVATLRAGSLPPIERPAAIYSPDMPFKP